jgi:hypothetical protein
MGQVDPLLQHRVTTRAFKQQFINSLIERRNENHDCKQVKIKGSEENQAFHTFIIFGVN